LQQEVQALLHQAEHADQRDEDPQRLPEAMARRETLRKKMDAACARLEARAKARAEGEQAESQRQLASRQSRQGRAPGSAPHAAAGGAGV
jgi:hypothetical protein